MGSRCRKGKFVPQDAHDAFSNEIPSINNPWFTTRTTFARSIARTFFLLMVCAYFATRYVSNSSFLNLSLYTAGLERKPYQYRVLPMYIFRVLIRSRLVLKIASHIAFFNRDPYTVIFAGIAFLAMVGALVATHLSISKLTGDSIYGFWAAFALALMGDLQLASPGCFILPYDVLSLFFFSSGIYLIISRRYLGYYLLFPLAVLNRETACFISVFFVVWDWVRLSKLGIEVKSRVLRIGPHAAIQAIVWLGIKAYLARAYAHNPVEGGSKVGGLFTTMLQYNLREVLKPQQWPILMSVCGFSLPFIYFQRRWIRCDGLLYACAIILPIYFVIMMLVGVIVELRIFTEWIALTVPTIALIVHNRLRPEPEPVV
jgi:hypothetical protein